MEFNLDEMSIDELNALLAAVMAKLEEAEAPAENPEAREGEEPEETEQNPEVDPEILEKLSDDVDELVALVDQITERKAAIKNNAEKRNYENMMDMTVEGMNSGVPTNYSPAFINYVENIYVGYKFYETAAAEGIIDYEKTVQYPFGYGLSYTNFSQKMGEIKEADGVISFDVTVTNEGSVPGKDVVEVYYNPPYTNGGIEKASANLVRYAKTGMLEPGASETVTITFDAEEMASYDEKGAGCYVLEKGDYIISVNSDSHTILDSRTYTVGSTVTFDESNPRKSDDIAAVNVLQDLQIHRSARQP